MSKLKSPESPGFLVYMLSFTTGFYGQLTWLPLKVVQHGT